MPCLPCPGETVPPPSVTISPSSSVSHCVISGMHSEDGSISWLSKDQDLSQTVFGCLLCFFSPRLSPFASLPDFAAATTLEVEALTVMDARTLTAASTSLTPSVTKWPSWLPVFPQEELSRSKSFSSTLGNYGNHSGR